MKPRYFILLFYISFLMACSGVCENEVSQTISSPSGSLKAVVFSRNCGATTGFNTQISVLPSNETLPNDGGNTFIVDGTVPIVVKWKTDATLQVSGLGRVSTVKQNSQVSGVVVTYAN